MPMVIGAIYISVKQAIKEARCDHKEYYETRSCDAICKNCGKNLGFIGTLRDKK
jgi:hypothetical protein